jgi:hypothetical protein
VLAKQASKTQTTKQNEHNGKQKTANKQRTPLLPLPQTTIINNLVHMPSLHIKTARQGFVTVLHHG